MEIDTAIVVVPHTGVTFPQVVLARWLHPTLAPAPALSLSRARVAAAAQHVKHRPECRREDGCVADGLAEDCNEAIDHIE